MNDKPILHVYGQDTEHEPVFIVGTNAGLRLLRDALDAAIRAGNARVTPTCQDGEGFDLHVIETDDEMRLPYREWTGLTGMSPWILVRKVGGL